MSNKKLITSQGINIAWKTFGVIPITRKNPSANSKKNLFIPSPLQLNSNSGCSLMAGFSASTPKRNLFIPSSFELNYNGGCSLVAELTVVVREARVRFSASTLQKKEMIKW